MLLSVYAVISLGTYTGCEQHFKYTTAKKYATGVVSFIYNNASLSTICFNVRCIPQK